MSKAVLSLLRVKYRARLNALAEKFDFRQGASQKHIEKLQNLAEASLISELKAFCKENGARLNMERIRVGVDKEYADIVIDPKMIVGLEAGKKNTRDIEDKRKKAAAVIRTEYERLNTGVILGKGKQLAADIAEFCK